MQCFLVQTLPSNVYTKVVITGDDTCIMQECLPPKANEHCLVCFKSSHLDCKPSYHGLQTRAMPVKHRPCFKTLVGGKCVCKLIMIVVMLTVAKYSSKTQISLYHTHLVSELCVGSIVYQLFHHCLVSIASSFMKGCVQVLKQN